MTDLHLNETPAHPASEQSVSRRDRILEAAASAFATHGYRGSSLRDIAHGAECSLTLLDHHFGGKDQLLDAVLQWHHDNCERRLKSLRDLLHGNATLDDVVANGQTMSSTYPPPRTAVYTSDCCSDCRPSRTSMKRAAESWTARKPSSSEHSIAPILNWTQRHSPTDGDWRQRPSTRPSSRPMSA